MLPDVESAVREISAGLNDLRAEGRQTQAQLQRWAEVARRAKELVQPHVTGSGWAAPIPPVSSPAERLATTTEPTSPFAASQIAASPSATSTACTSCGNTLKPGSKFCTKCGTKTQSAPIDAERDRACAICGAALRPEVRFCNACGAPAVQTAQQPAPAPAPAPPPTSGPVWRPTHIVPPDGMAAWSSPDGTVQPVAQLGARTELEVVSQLGAWAEVRASNGWVGWVDGRLLVSR